MAIDTLSDASAQHQPASYAIVPAADFHFLTPFYDLLCALFGLSRQFQRGVVTQLALQGAERLLDVGCGTGMLLDELTRRYQRVMASGVDADPKILRIANRRLNSKRQRADLHCARGENLPLPNASFDVAVSTLVFHHLPSPAKRAALYEIYRVLMPGGRFLLVDFGARPSGMVPWWQRSFESVDYLEDHVRGRIPLLMAEAGFMNVRQVNRRWPGVEYWAGEKPRAVPASKYPLRTIPSRAGPEFARE